MDDELRAAERAGDAERVQRLKERAGRVPFRVFGPDPEGRAWVPLEGGQWSFPSLEAAAEELCETRREVADDDAYLVVYDEERGYLAAARYPADPPEPAEVLCEDEERFFAGELEERPTLLGSEGTSEFWDVQEDAERYDEIVE